MARFADVNDTVRPRSNNNVAPNLTGRQQVIGNESESAATAAAIPDAARGPLDDTGSRYTTASIQGIHRAFPHWASPVMVTVRNQNGLLTVVGIERPTEMREK